MRLTMFPATLIAFAALAIPPKVHADPDDDALATMKTRAKQPNSVDEGRQNNKNRLDTGSVVDWITTPGEVYVEASKEGKWTGTIIVHFTGRERRADYVTGAQRATNDSQTSGRVLATYEIGRSGRLSISDVRKEGGQGRVGDAVVRHLHSLNGAMLR